MCFPTDSPSFILYWIPAQETQLYLFLSISKIISLVSMLATESRISNEELEMLTMEHNRAMDMLQELQNTLEDEFAIACNLLQMDQPQNSKPLALNLGFIHSVLTHIESTCQLVELIKANPQSTLHRNEPTLNNWRGKQHNKMQYLSSIYLTYKHTQPPQQSQKTAEVEPQAFLQKHRYSTQLKLRKGQLREHFLREVESGCQSVYTLSLESDPMDQENQIEDIDIMKFTTSMFRNLSVLNLQDSSVTDSSIELLRDRFPQVKHLNLSGCYMLTDRAIKMLGETGESFVSLSLNSMNSIKSESFLGLIESSINLNYLSIRDNPQAVHQDYFVEVYQIYRLRNAQLKWLQITSNHGIDLFVNKLMYMTSANTSEDITDQEFKTLLGESPPAYTGIFFDNCQELTKATLDLLMDKCKDVRKLGLSKFLHLNDSWLRDLTLCLRGIVFLDISCCYNVTDNGLYHVSENLVGQSLEYLILERCMSITDQGLRYILEKNALNFLTPHELDRKLSASPQKRRGTKLTPDIQNLQRTNSSKRLKDPVFIEEIPKGTLRHLNISRCRKITDQSLNLLSTSAYSLQALDISYCDQISDRPIQLISQRLVNLRSLNLNYCESLTDSSISMLATRLINKLEVLQIEWCEVSQSCIRYIAENLVHLKVLNLSYCSHVVSQEVQLIARNMPHLHTLKLQTCDKISEPALLQLGTCLDKLRIITLKECREVTDTVVKMLTGGNKKLEHLDISWCIKITDKALFAIAKNCYCLKYLNLNGCVEVTDEGLQWLQSLNLTLCSKVTDVGLLDITTHMKDLKHLYLAQLEELTDSSITSISNLSKLEQLVLAGCTQITGSSLIGLLYNLEKLAELNISQCRAVDGSNLWKICQFMVNIKMLEISEIQVGDEFLNELAIHCPKLRYLNLCYCNNVTDATVLKTLQKLPRLVKMDIQNTNIKDRTIAKIFHALNSRKMEQIVLD